MPRTLGTDADNSPGVVRVRASLPEGPPRSRWVVLLSLAAHVGLILLVIRIGLTVAEEHGAVASALSQRFGGGGGGGTGGSAFISLPPPPPPPAAPPITPPPIAVTVPDVTPVTPQPQPPVVTPTTIDSAPKGPPTTGTVGTGGGSGGGAGTGTGTGSGSGVGPGSGSGTGGGNSGSGKKGSPPESRFLGLPPFDDAPKSLRGKSVDVTFRIDAAGAVLGLTIVPPITDRKFATKFDEIMRSYRFRPARDGDGLPVAGVLTMTITF